MTSAISARVYTGSGAGTESSAQTAIALCAADALSGADVAPGTNSYERWIRLRVDAVPAIGVTDLWVQNTGDLPPGVAIKFGVTDTPHTPVAALSAVATMELTSGRRFIFDTSVLGAIGSHSRYIVLQGQVASDADAGPIDTQGLVFGWRER